MKTLCVFFLITLALLTVAAPDTHGQAKKQAQADIIAFLKDVYASDIPAADVAKHHVGLARSANDFSAEKRYGLAASHIQMLREGKSIAMPKIGKPALDHITVIPYNQLSKGQALPFEANAEQLQHVYAAIEDGAVIRYFIYQNGKVQSFDYLMKGKDGPHYFISY
jgi:hypothetical protein